MTRHRLVAGLNEREGMEVFTGNGEGPQGGDWPGSRTGKY